MSTTFYVQDWHLQDKQIVKVLASERFSTSNAAELEMLCKNDPYFTKDENGDYYENEEIYNNPYPDVTVSYMHHSIFLNLLGQNNESCGTIKNKALDDAIKAVLKSVNTDNVLTNNSVPETRSDNMIDCGLSVERIKTKLELFLELLIFAKKENKSVYWG